MVGHQASGQRSNISRTCRSNSSRRRRIWPRGPTGVSSLQHEGAGPPGSDPASPPRPGSAGLGADQRTRRDVTHHWESTGVERARHATRRPQSCARIFDLTSSLLFQGLPLARTAGDVADRRQERPADCDDDVVAVWPGRSSLMLAPCASDPRWLLAWCAAVATSSRTIGQTGRQLRRSRAQGPPRWRA